MLKYDKHKLSKHFRVLIPLYGFYLDIFVGKSKEEMKEQYHKVFSDEVESPNLFGIATEFAFYDDKNQSLHSVIFLTEDSDRNLMLSYMSHEAIHTVLDVCNIIGINIDVNNQEPIAYLYQYLFEKCMEVVDEIPKEGRAS